jgi:hypothetical protein
MVGAPYFRTEGRVRLDLRDTETPQTFKPCLTAQKGCGLPPPEKVVEGEASNVTMCGSNVESALTKLEFSVLLSSPLGLTRGFCVRPSAPSWPSERYYGRYLGHGRP